MRGRAGAYAVPPAQVNRELYRLGDRGMVGQGCSDCLVRLSVRCRTFIEILLSSARFQRNVHASPENKRKAALDSRWRKGASVMVVLRRLIGVFACVLGATAPADADVVTD